MPDSKFTPALAEESASALLREEVDYLFIGKSGAILLGYPDTTQDVDVFLPRSRNNAERVWRALASIGFKLDLVHAPDGIESFAAAKQRRIMQDGRFAVPSLDDMIASKRPTGRKKDLADIERLEAFRRSVFTPPS